MVLSKKSGATLLKKDISLSQVLRKIGSLNLVIAFRLAGMALARVGNAGIDANPAAMSFYGAILFSSGTKLSPTDMASAKLTGRVSLPYVTSWHATDIAARQYSFRAPPKFLAFYLSSVTLMSPLILISLFIVLFPLSMFFKKLK